jgi:hypothetical protein
MSVEPGTGAADAAPRALLWLAEQRAYFSPLRTLTPKAAKPAAELGLLLGRLLDSTALPADPAVRALVDLLETIGRRPDVRSRPVRCVADALLHAAIGGVLERAGRPAREHREVVRRAVAAGVFDHADRMAYHVLEERLLLEWAGVAHDLPPAGELAASSMLARRLSALRLAERTTYQLTHDVMFLCGLDPARGLPPGSVDVANLGTVLADLLVSFAAERHWDLLGELLICWDSLHLPQNGLYRQAFAELLAQQAPDGSFAGPPPPGNPDHDPAEEAARFAHRYHTTLVAVLALDVAARRSAVAHPVEPPAPDVEAASPANPPVRTALHACAVDRTAVRRDAAWLASLLARPGAARPAVAGGALVGTRLCAALDGELAVADVAERVADLLDATTGVASAPPALTLAAFALLRHDGHAPAAPAAFVEQAAAVLAARPPASAAADLLLCEKRILLHRLGLAAPPMLLPAARAHEIVDGLPLRPSSEHLATAVLAAESATGHGTVPGDDPAASAVLARHAIHQLRLGDLGAGCATLRAAHHLHPLPAGRVAEVTDHLLLQQGPDGGYGHVPAPDDPALHGVDLDLDFRLPTTLTCLWTLAELHSDFRLYASIRAADPVAAGAR